MDEVLSQGLLGDLEEKALKTNLKNFPKKSYAPCTNEDACHKWCEDFEAELLEIAKQHTRSTVSRFILKEILG